MSQENVTLVVGNQCEMIMDPYLEEYRVSLLKATYICRLCCCFIWSLMLSTVRFNVNMVAYSVAILLEV